MTSGDLRSIASSGGGLILDASKFTAGDLRSIASASEKNASIYLKNISKFTAGDLRSIASAGNGTVVFDFT